jgi:hypothetical protein
MADSVFIATLLRENPGFLPDGRDVEDGFTYVIANDFARYIIDLEQYNEIDRRNIALGSLERLATGADNQLTDLVKETLETLSENRSTNTDLFNSQLGSQLRVIRQQLLAYRTKP